MLDMNAFSGPLPPPSLPTTQPTPLPPFFPSLPLPLNQPPLSFPGSFPLLFPPYFGFFPFHSLCPPHISPLNTPPITDLPLQPPIWSRPTSTISPTLLPNKLPPPSSAPQGRGGGNSAFRIDSKTFSFSFDDGWADSYAIHKGRRNFKNYVWMGRKGLEWLLSCFADIRDWVPGKDYLCKHFRANNKFFEFWGRSNEVGIFMEIAVYFGGARHGWVMVPVTSNWSGWCLFTKELDRFLSASNIVWVEGKFVDEAVGGGSMEGGGQDGKKSFNIGDQRNLRNFEISRAILGHNVQKGFSAVTVSSKNGRPTREFKFNVTSANLALRVTKSARAGHVKAYLAEPSGKAQMEGYYHLGLGVGKSCTQSASVVGECSKLPMKSTKTPMLLEALTAVILLLPSSDQVSELLPSYPMRVLGVPKIGNGSASRNGYVVDVFNIVKAGSSMGSVSDAEVSIVLGVSSATASVETPMLKDVPPILDRIEDEFEEGEVLVEEHRGNSVYSGGGVQTESGLHILLWKNREVVDHSCDGGEEDFCVLECDPLSRCEPNELRELVLVQDFVEGTQVMESVTPSNWVS
nr:hypothetical protein CFP56_17592 [Quercus suber]